MSENGYDSEEFRRSSQVDVIAMRKEFGGLTTFIHLSTHTRINFA